MARIRIAWVAALAGVGAIACESTKPLPPAVLVSPASLTIEDGESAKITAKLRNTTTRVVTWSSSNTAVATVDLTGEVTGVTNGTATILVALTEDSTINTSVPVTVSGPPVATMTVSPSKVTVYVGVSFRMGAVLRAEDGRLIRGRPVTWSNPDATIADVSSTGLVRGRAPGGPITVTATSEGKSATSLVRVAHAAELCPFVAPIELGTPTTGRLALGDCEFSLDESYVDVYEFTLPAPATVQIDMTSAELDSYVGLFEATGRFLGEDDNSGGGLNSRLVRDLVAGKYRIWANTTLGATSGAYTLTVFQH